MDNALNTSVGQGGFMTELAGKVNSTEAFIIIIVALLSYGLWKIWGEMKHLLLDREHTAEKRNMEIGSMQTQITKLDGMIASHFQIHIGIDKKLDDLEELKQKTTRIETKLDLLLERRIPKPRLP